MINFTLHFSFRSCVPITFSESRLVLFHCSYLVSFVPSLVSLTCSSEQNKEELRCPISNDGGPTSISRSGGGRRHRGEMKQEERDAPSTRRRKVRS